MSNRLDPDQARRNVWPDLDPKLLARLIVQSVYRKIKFQPKPMLWVLRELSQGDGSFEHPKHVITDGQENIYNFMLKNADYLNMWLAENNLSE